MKKYFAKFLRDVYEGIYFLSTKYESPKQNLPATRGRFFISFFLYYFSILLPILAIKVVIYGPFKPSVIEALVYSFGIYGCIYKFIIYPLLDTSEIDQNIDPALKKRKIRISILTQVGGFICFFGAFTIVYFLYKK